MEMGGTTLAPGAAFPAKERGEERLLTPKVFYQKGEAFLKAGNILLLLAGFMLGRATILGEVAPFGAIFWLLVLREKPLQSFLVASAVLIGRGSAYGWLSALHLLWAMAAVWLLEGLCLRLLKRRFPLVLSALILIVISQHAAVLSLRFPYSMEAIFLGLEAIIGCLAAVVMQPVVRLIDRLPRSRDRPLAKQLEQEEVIAVFLFLFLFLFSLRGVTVGSLSVEVAAKMLLLLGAAYLLGVGWGSAMGIITGTILGLGNPYFYLVIGSLSFSGFWAGLLKTYGRWGCAAGFLFSLPVLHLLAPGDMPGIYWREGLLSLVIFLAVPSRYFQGLSLQLQKVEIVKQGTEEERSRQLIARRIDRFADLFKELSLGFAQAAAGNARDERVEPYPFLEELMDRVCRSCLFRRRCWEKDLYSHHRLILDLMARAEVEGAVEEAHLPPAFRERCHQPELLIKAINNLQEVWQLNRFWEKKVEEGKKLVAEQLEGLAQIMENLALEVERSPFPPVVGEQAPLFNLELGLAQKAGRHNGICGDSFSLFKLDASRQAVIISDGMGNGPRAADESKATVQMLEHLLGAGLHKEAVLRTANSLLQLRSGEESFATVDMALFDLREGEVELFKIGAAPGFLKRGKEVSMIGASSLPMGILPNIEAECHYLKLYPADLLVMATDGLAELDGDSSWLLSYLRRLEKSPPQVVAERILEEAVRRSKGVLRDDLTVVTCRLHRLERRPRLLQR